MSSIPLMHQMCLIKDHIAEYLGTSLWHLTILLWEYLVNIPLQLCPMSPLKKSLLSCSCLILFLLLVQVVLSWSCLLLYGAYRFLQWTQLLSTWKGIILFASGLALVTGVMHVFIMFSQSERSSTARAARNRVKKDWWLLIPSWQFVRHKREAIFLSACTH